MNTQAQEILGQRTTKAAKIHQLHALGYTIKEIAEMVGSGEGYVYVVIHYRNNNPPRNNRTASAMQFQPFNRKFGIEIEMFGVEKRKLLNAIRAEGIEIHDENYNHATRPHWKLVSDSSIQGSLGIEIVSPPLQGLEGLAQVEKVCSALSRVGAKVNKSCGFHVHIDASTFTLDNWKNIYKNYILLEDVIDSFMPISRRASNNYYCKSLKNGAVRTLVSNIDNCNSVAEVDRLITRSDRYYKINYQAFLRHGTIEFRQHSGTVEYHKISNWVLFLHHLIAYSERNVVSGQDFESLSKFIPAELSTYLQGRINDLSA